MTIKYDKVKQRILNNVGIALKSKEQLENHPSTNPRRRGALIGHLNDCARGDVARHAILNWLFGKSSTKELTDAEWFALDMWVDLYQDDEGWHPGSTFCFECFHIAISLRESVWLSS